MRKPKRLVYNEEDVKLLHTFVNSINANIQTFYFSSDKGELYYISDGFYNKLTTLMNLTMRTSLEIKKTYGKNIKLTGTGHTMMESQDTINEFFLEYKLGNVITYGDSTISLDRNSVGLPIQLMRFNLTVILYKRIIDKKYNIKGVSQSLLVKKEKLDMLIESILDMLVEYEILIPEDRVHKYFLKPIRKVINTKGEKISDDIKLYKFMKYNESKQMKRSILSSPDVYDFKKMKAFCKKHPLYEKVRDGTCVLRFMLNKHYRRQDFNSLFIIPKELSYKYRNFDLYIPTEEDKELMSIYGFTKDYIGRVMRQTEILRL